VHAELLKDEHGAPVIQGGLLKPRAAIEVRSDAGAKASFHGMGRVEADQHLVGYLGIAGLIGTHQAQPIAAQQRRLSIENEENGKSQENARLTDAGPFG
jgi:hypothetical protein